MGLRLGIDPSKLSFTYKNNEYKPVPDEKKLPIVLNLSYGNRDEQGT